MHKSRSAQEAGSSPKSFWPQRSAAGAVMMVGLPIFCSSLARALATPRVFSAAWSSNGQSARFARLGLIPDGPNWDQREGDTEGIPQRQQQRLGVANWQTARPD
ncbi:hypothetical protein GQ53DRAFT_767464 [Thozetella sp. PMI_491]|nr:hypothetical protein GQ53DRAFT_767464 [Thozetella sp. PMI_491]